MGQRAGAHLDVTDSYLAPGETCDPSDNLAPVLVAAEHADATGQDLLAALAGGLPGPLPVLQRGPGALPGV